MAYYGCVYIHRYIFMPSVYIIVFTQKHLYSLYLYYNINIIHYTCVCICIMFSQIHFTTCSFVICRHLITGLQNTVLSKSINIQLCYRSVSIHLFLPKFLGIIYPDLEKSYFLFYMKFLQIFTLLFPLWSSRCLLEFTVLPMFT